MPSSFPHPDLPRRRLLQGARGREYQGWRHVAFAVEDVDAAWARLKAGGADVVGNGAINFVPLGYRVAYARDPEGNFVELYQDGVK